MIGTNVDKYQVLRKVGEGGMATVYLGRHTALDREVAIKVLHPHLSASTRNRKRFAREARAIEQLRHPNIVEIFDYSGEGSDSWLVTEFVDGETLGALVERCGRLPSEVVALIGIALCEGLAYAHAHGILHRDLKPENVMIRHDGHIKLMDFGIARFLEESQVTMTGALVGSPAYMSPEQAREDALDARSDLFSLGTLLFFLATNRLPFTGSNPSLVLKHILENERPGFSELAPDASASLADVIERLLSPSRDDRPPSAAAAGQALRACLEEIGLPYQEAPWSLARFVADPVAWRSELRDWLIPNLLSRGRDLLAAGDALGGLRLVNRVLSIDDGNADAMGLLEGLHGEPARDPRGPPWMPLLAGLVLLTVLAVLTFGVVSSPVPATPPPGAGTNAAGAEVQAVAPKADVQPEPAGEVPPAQGEPAGAPTLPITEPDAVPQPPGALEPSVAEAVEEGQRGTPVRAAPRAPEAPASPVPAAPPAPACVAFRTPAAPADVHLDGVRLRSTREPGCAEVPSGHHVFVLSGPMVRERRVALDLAPGEVRDPVIVRLERVPARVRFREDLPSGCVVLVDGLAQGTLGELGHAVELEQPDTPHEVTLSCSGVGLARRYDRIDYPEVLFDARGGP